MAISMIGDWQAFMWVSLRPEREFFFDVSFSKMNVDILCSKIIAQQQFTNVAY